MTDCVRSPKFTELIELTFKKAFIVNDDKLSLIKCCMRLFTIKIVCPDSVIHWSEKSITVETSISRRVQ